MERIRRWAKGLKRDVLVLWLAARDSRTPLLAKALATLTVAYALSPIDLIPDFVPVLGLLDDLLLVPAGIWIVLRLLPSGLIADLRAQAADTPWPVPPRWAVAVIALTWLLTACCAAWLTLRD
ncbi:MAG: YkvA family protein [Novosphingobium sp.]